MQMVGQFRIKEEEWNKIQEKRKSIIKNRHLETIGDCEAAAIVLAVLRVLAGVSKNLVSKVRTRNFMISFMQAEE